ncbi:MAG TPA: hypothetical protein VLO30_04255 [Chthoniobacterales bacterium]|nr:hypothetical protein [Chthoniobacterales bacterium]
MKHALILLALVLVVIWVVARVVLAATSVALHLLWVVAIVLAIIWVIARQKPVRRRRRFALNFSRRNKSKFLRQPTLAAAAGFESPVGTRSPGFCF